MDKPALGDATCSMFNVQRHVTAALICFRHAVPGSEVIVHKVS